MFVIIFSKNAGCYTVGHYEPGGEWIPFEDFATESEAADRCHYLNGGQ